MKAAKLALAAALTAAIGTVGFAPVANAGAPSYSDGGTITVKGLVVAKTCTISFTGATQNGNDATVILPTVLASAFNSTREVAGGNGGEAFNMKISKCDRAYTHLDLRVTAQSGVDSEGNLENDITQNGSNVAVRMFPGTDNSGTPIDFNAGYDSGSLQLTSGGYTFDFFAEYYGPSSLGTATAGDVQSVAKYTITYN